MKPFVAVTPGFDPQTGITGVRQQYLDGILRAGGLPFLLPLNTSADEVTELLRRADAVLVKGGEDISPAIYGETLHEKLGRLDARRDALETALIRGAWAQDKPVLGICRGIQVMSASLGGSLWQDLPAQCGTDPDVHNQPEDYAFTKHAVTVTAGTLLSDIVGEGSVPVNSRHHQAVRTPAPGFSVCARSAGDGIIEAVWAPEKRFFLGVQSHPEMLADRMPVHQALFDALVRANR